MMPGESLRRLRRLKEVTYDEIFSSASAPPLFQAVPRSSTHPGGPRVTRIEDSRHRKYEVPLSQHHHSIRTIHSCRSLALEVV